MQAMADESIGCDPRRGSGCASVPSTTRGAVCGSPWSGSFRTPRYEMATNGTSQGFKFNNNARAACARRLIAAHPECERKWTCANRRSIAYEADLRHRGALPSLNDFYRMREHEQGRVKRECNNVARVEREGSSRDALLSPDQVPHLVGGADEDTMSTSRSGKISSRTGWLKPAY